MMSVGSVLILKDALIVWDCPRDELTVSWHDGGDAFSPVGLACNVKFAGVVPEAGLTLSQFADRQPETAAVKPTGACAFTATVFSKGVVLPCWALKATAPGIAVRVLGLTSKVSGTESGLFEACEELIVSVQL
jgi:hypothetical protein